MYSGELQRMNAPSERRWLDVGDITISNGACTFVIERKQWSDLAASICDGRLKEQKNRMISTENTTVRAFRRNRLRGCDVHIVYERRGVGRCRS